MDAVVSHSPAVGSSLTHLLHLYVQDSLDPNAPIYTQNKKRRNIKKMWTRSDSNGRLSHSKCGHTSLEEDTHNQPYSPEARLCDNRSWLPWLGSKRASWTTGPRVLRLMSECFIVRAMYERSSTVGSRKYIVCISSRLLHNMAYEMIKQTVSLSLNFQVCYITTPHLFVAHLLTYLRSLRELSTY
jgi:hypothetical protein